MVYNIFYKITNLINGKFYYGIHRTKYLNDNYMGSGIRIKHAIKKYGKENFKKEILYFFNTYKEALEFEERIVTEELIKNIDCYNISKGGKGYFIEGQSSWNKGIKYSEELKRRLSEIHKGNKSALGHKLSEDVKKRISEACKGKTPGNKGKHLSAEVKEKLRRANLGKKYSNEINRKKGRKGRILGYKFPKKPILQYTLNGVFIKEWESITKATEELSMSRGTISHCLTGDSKTAKGYIWKYKK